MQAWPLEKKVEKTKELIAEWYRYWKGKVFVSFSAGKDSTLLLHLAREVHPDIPAVFVDTGCEFPENIEFAKTVQNVVWLQYNIPFDEVLQKYGYPVISKEVSKRIYYGRMGKEWALQHLNGNNKDGTHSKYNQQYKKWRHLLEAPFPIAEKCCSELKLKPLAKYQRESKRVSIVGTMASESLRRQSAFLKTGCNRFDGKDPKSKPLSFWTEADVLRYLKENNVAYSKIYGDIINENGRWRTTGEKRTGCMFCLCGTHLEKPNRFQRMATTHPELYEHCINELGYGFVMDYLGIPYAPPEKISVYGGVGQKHERVTQKMNRSPAVKKRKLTEPSR